MIKKRISLAIVLIYPIIASLLSLLFHLNFFLSTIVFLAIPSLYLSILGKRYVTKLLIFTLLSSIPIIIIIDYLGQNTFAWAFPESIFPFKIFGVISLEVISWAFFNMFFVLIFYEYFLDNHIKPKLWNPHMKNLIIFLIFLIIPFSIFLIYLPRYFNIPYFYLTFGLLLFIFPVIWQLFFHPKILNKIFITGAYFFYLSLLYEITALMLGWWSFPSMEYIGWITIFTLSFPLEELVFWIGLFAIAVVSAFEFLDDDEK